MRERGFSLLDVQFKTEHLARFGCANIPRPVYLELARRACATDVNLERVRIII